MAKKLIIDCKTGQQVYVDLTPAEEAEAVQRAQDAAVALAAEAQANAERQAAIATLKAKAQTDPAFAALIKALRL